MWQIKKYYFLKVRNNHFDKPEIKLLESGENGYIYSLIFLKLLCKAEYNDRTTRIIKHKYKEIDILTSLSICIGHNKKIFESCINRLTELKLAILKPDCLILQDLFIDENRNRNTKQYKEWREFVFNRDNYICQKCKEKGSKLNAHHIKEWHKYQEDRFEINNGITLCIKCHKLIHQKKI